MVSVVQCLFFQKGFDPILQEGSRPKVRWLLVAFPESPSQSKYPVLHEGAFGGTGFLLLGRLGIRASTEKKMRADYEHRMGGFFLFSGAKKIEFF